MQGIFKPRALELPISLRTTPPKPGQPPPYEDDWDGDVRRYAFRTDDARGRVENNLLLRTMDEGVPLVYLIGLDPGSYYAEYPTFHRRRGPREPDGDARRHPVSALVTTTEERARYATREVRTRLHQARFRGRVLTAYRTSCAVCRLRHGELIDAAHIVPDRDERGVPEVNNGLSLCKIHHAAFDADLVGIRPTWSSSCAVTCVTSRTARCSFTASRRRTAGG